MKSLSRSVTQGISGMPPYSEAPRARPDRGSNNNARRRCAQVQIAYPLGGPFQSFAAGRHWRAFTWFIASLNNDPSALLVRPRIRAGVVVVVVVVG
jgi:hypothetical protein